MRAAIYARVSTADGRQDADNQIAELRWFADAQGWEIVGEYVDHESGAKSDRTEFRRLFADAAQRKFDVLVFWALDRLTREGALETLQYLNRLSGYGVGFRSFQALLGFLRIVQRRRHCNSGSRSASDYPNECGPG